MREARISIVNTRFGGLESTPVVMARARERIESVSRDRPDIILMTEIFANHWTKPTRESVAEYAQTVTGPIAEELSSLANKYRTYIAFGLLRQDGDRFFNSLVLLNREGKPVWIYDKFTPMPTELIDCGISAGGFPESYLCDFGRVGGAICFDINFSELAEIYCRQEIELLLFASAFPAGRLLDAWSVRYGFAIAGSTLQHYNRVIDCTGTTVGQTSEVAPCATTVLNLNRRAVHIDENWSKLDKMRTQYAGDVIVEDLRNEGTCVITSLKTGLEVADLIREFEIETLPNYLDRARRTRQQYGGLRVPEWY